MYGEAQDRVSNLYVLPWCIDKWRKYVKERKTFKYWMSYLENFHDTDKRNKRWAFERWAVQVQGHKNKLKTW